MVTMSSRPYAVILAGGGGTRLWPLSRPERPKPFLPLLADGSTPLTATLERLLPMIPLDDVYVVVATSQVALVRESLPQIDPLHIIAEPISRNTGPAVALATVSINRPSDAPMLVIPADHAVLDAAAWRDALIAAISIAAREPRSLVTLGVVPTRPETGFGYIIARGERVERFTEKPNRDEAARLIAAGARWNAGTFVWQRGSIRAALERYGAAVLAGIAAYETVPAGPIDTLVMEPAAADGLVRTVPLDCGWSDIGSWSELRTHLLAAALRAHPNEAPTDMHLSVPGGRTITVRVEGGVMFTSPNQAVPIDLARMSGDELRAASREA